jgi:hypothetical protein
MRYGVSVALVVSVLVVSGCSDEEPEHAAPAPAPSQSRAPAYDATLEPAAAVLSLLPEDAETVTVTDFDRVRLELGMGELTDQSPPQDVATFWQRATAELPLLSPGMLRPADQRLAAAYGFTQLDVAWEAHFYGADDREAGWVLRFRDSADMSTVMAATKDPAGTLSGGDVDAAERLVSSGTTDDPAHSWAADPGNLDLVGLPANSTYVSRACVDQEPGDDLDELAAYSIQFEGSLVTARLGEGRQDLFARMRLGEQEPDFAAAYDGGVADPLTGRIGYVMTDPAAAAGLALEHDLPFAACA